MQIKRKALAITASVILALGATASGVFITGAAAGTSIITAVVEALETEEVLADETEEVEEPDDLDEPDPDLPPIPQKPGINTELYNKLLHIDWDSVPDNIRIDRPWPFKNIVSPKAYALAYMLATEICLRGEINPEGTTEVITPEHLIGKWMLEHVTQNVPEDDYLTWADFGSTEGTACGAFGMMPAYYMCSDAGSAIYISRLENPSLADNERAIIGNHSDFRNNKGRYATEKLISDGFNALEVCSLNTLTSNIMQGKICSSEGMIAKDRPSVVYFPDAMYMTALGVRLGLEGYTLDQITSKGCDFAALKDIRSLSEYGVGSIYSDCAIALSFTQYAGSPFVDGASKDLTSEGSGLFYKIAVDAIQSGTSPLTILSATNDKTELCNYLSNGSGNFVRKVVAGTNEIDLFDFAMYVDTASSSGNLDANTIEALAGLSTGSMKSSMLLTIIKNAKDANVKNGLVATNSIGSYIYKAYIDPAGLLGPYAGVDGYDTYPSNGFGIINAAAIVNITIGDVVDDLYALFGSKSINSELLDGHTCLGADCWCHYNREPIAVFNANDIANSSLFWHKESQRGVDPNQNAIAKLEAITTTRVGNMTYMNDLALPVTLVDGEPAPRYLFGTYPSHAGDGIDWHVQSETGKYLTRGSEVHAIADGVIVEMGCYPIYPGNSSDYKIVTGAPANGNFIRLMHKVGNAYYTSVYCHLTSFGHLKVGSAVAKGAFLGMAGTTGQSTGYHPHVGIYRNTNTGDLSEVYGLLEFAGSYLKDYPECLVALKNNTVTTNQYAVIADYQEGRWKYITSQEWY